MSVISKLCSGLLAMVWALFVAPAEAAFTFLGPSPYLSKADSPFPVFGNHPNFYLEDFEQKEPCVPGEFTFCTGAGFNAPGVRMTQGIAIHGSSVDSDDFAIDGSGVNGGSAMAKSDMIIGSSSVSSIVFEFDANELGFLPTAVGFVFTDGAGPGSGVGVYDAFGSQASFLTWDLDLDSLTTADDRFIGVVNPASMFED